jgi:Fe-S cluster assembly ATP-binding protein
MIQIKNLHASINGVEILKGLNLEVKPGEVHAIMGPNGSGKSTLAKVIAGHPSYKVTEGEVKYDINFKMKNLLEMAPHERAREGVFLAFQYPVEVPGVTNFTFLKTAFNSISKHQGAAELNDEQFRTLLNEKMKLVQIDPKFIDRPINEGFSGGEKKRNEILQMAVLSPRLAFLDETDSGLDIDALRIVSDGVNALKKKDNAIVLVTHYQRLLDYIVPDHVHVLSQGRIIKSGGKELALKLEDQGYDWLLHEN